ncbi:triosephosphate isomerase [Candidatus Gottesmanbacteria bacterium]|nr:triosephosphate isomerase [Candidatus Gottesmanbacteria bacterium]
MDEKKYIIGNWKSNKNLLEVRSWFTEFNELFKQGSQTSLDNLEIVICPPFIYLPEATKLINNYNLPISLGAQDVSPFTTGAYTGEVGASQIADFAKFVLIGHSERRSNFGENSQLLFAKTEQAEQQGLQVIYCVPDNQTKIPQSVGLVAYEPVWAIGTGKTESAENAVKVADVIRKNLNAAKIIYGGSVNSKNIKDFLAENGLDGVLPGGASLDASLFWEMIKNASRI